MPRHILALIVSGALVFLLVYLLYAALYSPRNGNAMHGSAAAFTSACWFTAQYVGLFFLVRWVKSRPLMQQRAAYIGLGVVVLLLVGITAQYLSVPSQIISPLIPDSLVDYARAPLIVQGFFVIMALLIGVLFLVRNRPVGTLITACAIVLLVKLLPTMWWLLPEGVRPGS